MNAIDEKALLNSEAEESKDTNEIDDTLPEELSLSSSNFLIHVWQFVQPFFVWISLLLPVVFVGLSVLMVRFMVLVSFLWWTMMAVVSMVTMVSMRSMRSVMTPEFSLVYIWNVWFSIEFWLKAIIIVETFVHWWSEHLIFLILFWEKFTISWLEVVITH